MTALPKADIPKKSDKEINQFFDRYYDKPLEFAANDVDSVLAFLQKEDLSKVQQLQFLQYY